MFFGLDPIVDHPCLRMQEVVECFFYNSIDRKEFSIILFPEWIRPTLEGAKCTLDEKFEKVHGYLHAPGVDLELRSAIYNQLLASNYIESLCNGTARLPVNVIDWQSPLGIAIKELMDSLYGSLDLVVFKRSPNAISPTKELYNEFIGMNKYVCPFCSLDKYINRWGTRREDFDHYLNKSRYPLSAVNFQNLVPTCRACNQDYKKAKDILSEGTVFYPYSDIPEVKIQVDCAKYPPTTDLNDKGDWVVVLEPVVPDDALIPKMRTWNRVFEISQRLENEVREFFEEWMEQISDNGEEVDEETYRKLIEAAKEKAKNNSSRRMAPGEIVKAAFYEFMLERAEEKFALSFVKAQNARTQERSNAVTQRSN